VPSSLISIGPKSDITSLGKLSNENGSTFFPKVGNYPSTGRITPQDLNIYKILLWRIRATPFLILPEYLVLCFTKLSYFCKIIFFIIFVSTLKSAKSLFPKPFI